jgi:hypothetical protein
LEQDAKIPHRPDTEQIGSEVEVDEPKRVPVIRERLEPIFKQMPPVAENA